MGEIINQIVINSGEFGVSDGMKGVLAACVNS